MTHTTNREQVLSAALAAIAGIDPDTIPTDGRLPEDLGIDSLALHELIVALEKQLAVTIPDEEVGRLNTLGDVRTLLARLTSETDRP